MIRSFSYLSATDYGKQRASEIAAFFAKEISDFHHHESYVRACIEPFQRHAPRAFSFIEQMSQGAGIPLEHAVALQLHEELWHRRFYAQENPAPSYDGHCTAVASGTLLAENWDWQESLSPFASVGKYAGCVAYEYPGLPFCAGVNSYGVGLVWAGSGYYPTLNAQAGVPSYALTAEVLQSSSAKEAVAYLRSVPAAGPYIFLISDADGDAHIVEQAQGRIHVTETYFSIRANHFSHLDVPQQIPVGESTLLREAAARERLATAMDQQQILAVLREEPIYRTGSVTSLDTLLIDCAAKMLAVMRFGSPQMLYFGAQ